MPKMQKHTNEHVSNVSMDKKSRKAPTNLGLRVYDAIVATLAKGDNPYQGKIVRSALAAQLGCSVTAITAHLRALQARGFIRYQSSKGRKGTYVWLTAKNLFDKPQPSEIPAETANRRAANAPKNDSALAAAVQDTIRKLTDLYNEAVTRAYQEGYKAGRAASNEQFRRFLESLELGDND